MVQQSYRVMLKEAGYQRKKGLNITLAWKNMQTLLYENISVLSFSTHKERFMFFSSYNLH